MHCREILFTSHSSPRAREFLRWVNFSLRRTVTTVVEQRGVKITQFSDFGLFSPYKTLKTYLPIISLQRSGYIAEWFRFFDVIDEGPKGWLPASEFPATSGKRAEDPQTCATFRLWQMAISIQNATARRVRSRPNMPANAEIGGRYILRGFPLNNFAPTPKIPQNPILGDLSMQNLLQRVFRKSHVNGATKLKPTFI